MLIANGTVVTAAGQQRADVRISGEQIAEIAPDLVASPDEEVIDATGLLVLPGGVDPHTHMDLLVGGLRATDSFATGTVAAACGGTTTIIDHMGFGAPEAQGSLVERIAAYHELADGQAVIDYGFHGVIDRTSDAVLAELEELPKLGVTSLKFYLTYDGRLSDEQVIRLLTHTKELGILACVHCENHAILSWLRERFFAEGKVTPHYHPLSRPDYCEAEAVGRVLDLARAAGDAPLYIVHTSTDAALRHAQNNLGKHRLTVHGVPSPHLLRGLSWDNGSALGLTRSFAASPDNSPLDCYPRNECGDELIGTFLAAAQPAILETCPQYLTLDDSLYDAPGDEGLKYIMSPPLRKPVDQEALWQALADGRISTVGTDHCPWNFATEKQLGRDDFTKCPNGAPGVELRLALLYSEGVVKRGLPLERMVEVAATAPAQVFGLYPRKGTIAVGSDADLVLFDPARHTTVHHDLLHENVDYTPYEGMELTGWPTTTISRGEVIARDGAYCGTPARGRYLYRR